MASFLPLAGLLCIALFAVCSEASVNFNFTSALSGLKTNPMALFNKNSPIRKLKCGGCICCLPFSSPMYKCCSGNCNCGSPIFVRNSSAGGSQAMVNPALPSAFTYVVTIPGGNQLPPVAQPGYSGYAVAPTQFTGAPGPSATPTIYTIPTTHATVPVTYPTTIITAAPGPSGTSSSVTVPSNNCCNQVTTHCCTPPTPATPPCQRQTTTTTTTLAPAPTTTTTTPQPPCIVNPPTCVCQSANGCQVTSCPTSQPCWCSQPCTATTCPPAPSATPATVTFPPATTTTTQGYPVAPSSEQPEVTFPTIQPVATTTPLPFFPQGTNGPTVVPQTSSACCLVTLNGINAHLTCGCSAEVNTPDLCRIASSQGQCSINQPHQINSVNAYVSVGHVMICEEAVAHGYLSWAQITSSCGSNVRFPEVGPTATGATIFVPTGTPAPTPSVGKDSYVNVKSSVGALSGLSALVLAGIAVYSAI